MVERELKFDVPDERRDAIQAELSALPASQRQRLVSVYVDTADRSLARHQVALRLRHDGGHWEQTLKAVGDTPVERHEDNVARPGDWPADGPPIDPSLHAGTPAFDRLREALADSADPTLGAVFISDFVRLRADLLLDDARIEVAFDQGLLRAERRDASSDADDTAKLAGAPTLPIQELELELKSGPSRALITAATQWADRHALWIDTISKAARGERLAQGRVGAVATPGRIAAFGGGKPPDGRTLLRRWTAVCLEQVLGNASQLSAGEGPPDAEVVHQLRVGLRRLRSVWRELGRCADEPIDWQPAVRESFDALGRVRDRDAAVARFADAITAAGGRTLDPSGHGPDPDLRALIRARPFQHAMLSLLAFALDADGNADDGKAGGGKTGGGKTDRPQDDRDGIDLVVQRLRKLHRGLRQAARRFDTLTDDDRHRVRKRAKRLRYLIELARPLLPTGDADAYLKRLRRTQQRLGDYQDLCTAIDAYRDAVHAGQHDAWFGVGWLEAGRARHLARCRKALRRLARTRPPLSAH